MSDLKYRVPAVHWLVAAGLMCAQGVALAGDPLIDRLRACAAEANDAKRLACYDTGIGRSKPGQNEDLGVTGELLRHQQREAATPAATPRAPPAVPAPPPNPPNPPNQLSAKVVAVAKPLVGKFVVILDNGQVWQQQELVDFSLEVGDIITIRKGLLGALWMTNGKSRIQTQVQRIK